MEQNGTHAGEEELILALAAGATVREAAEQAGVGERTAHQRLADADFRRAVNEARGGMFDAARGRLASLASKAAETFGAAKPRARTCDPQLRRRRAREVDSAHRPQIAMRHGGNKMLQNATKCYTI
jgi:hypothetical protein